MKGGTSEGREGEQRERSCGKRDPMADCNTNYAIRTCYRVRLHLSINSCTVTYTGKRLINKRILIGFDTLYFYVPYVPPDHSPYRIARYALRLDSTFDREEVRDPAFFQRIGVDARSCKKFKERRLKHEGVCITWCSPVRCLGHIPSGASRLSESSR